MVTANLDVRVQIHLEEKLGVPFSGFPASGAEVRESPKRTDKRESRLFIIRIGDTAWATAIPRVATVLSPIINSLTVSELFSPLGLAELSRALGPEDTDALTLGFDYTLTDVRDFRPAPERHAAVALTRKGISPDAFHCELDNLPPQPDSDDCVWAFACYRDDAETTELAKFGPNCVSAAAVFWKSDGLVEVGVGTAEPFRGQGYALAVVSAATQFILDQGAVAWYGAEATNIPSLRIARRLGYRFGWQTIWG